MTSSGLTKKGAYKERPEERGMSLEHFWRENVLEGIRAEGERWVEREYSLKGLVRKDEKL